MCLNLTSQRQGEFDTDHEELHDEGTAEFQIQKDYFEAVHRSTEPGGKIHAQAGCNKKDGEYGLTKRQYMVLLLAQRAVSHSFLSIDHNQRTSSVVRFYSTTTTAPIKTLVPMFLKEEKT